MAVADLVDKKPNEWLYQRLRDVPMNLKRIDRDTAYRLLPRQGKPTCFIEWVAQVIVIALAWAPLYTAVLLTLTVITFLVGVPFIEGK